MDINNDSLLRQKLVEHYTKPINKGLKNNPDSIIKHAKSNTCADELIVEYMVENNIIREVSFDGTACVVATASADIFLSMIVNQNLDYVRKLISTYKGFLNQKNTTNFDFLQDLNVFKNIYLQKNRIICAELCLSAFE